MAETGGVTSLPMSLGVESEAAPSVCQTLQKTGRLFSLDAYRGFVMLILVSSTYTRFTEGFGFAEVAKHFEESKGWQFLAHQFTHVAWRGGSFWDLIMPAFIFMAGVAMPYSYFNRLAEGHSYGRLAFHALYRSFAFILLGTIGFLFLGNWIMLRWMPRQINPEFSAVLPQIGLGYAFVFFLLGKRANTQLRVAFGILAGYWLAFVLYPLPDAGIDYSSVGGGDFTPFTGFFAHWNNDTNLAADFDRWFLNLIPRSQPFEFRKEGITTLNFIPTLSTMIFGVVTGGFLRGPKEPKEKFKGLLIAGALGLLGGIVLDLTLCPIVKAIWTPSWVLYSAGWVLLMLAAFFWLIEVKGYRRWSFPLVIVGMNAIAVYCLANLFDYWIFKVWEKSVGKALFSGLYGPIWKSLTAVLSLWLVSLAMYRRRVFIRI